MIGKPEDCLTQTFRPENPHRVTLTGGNEIQNSVSNHKGGKEIVDLSCPHYPPLLFACSLQVYSSLILRKNAATTAS